MSFLNLALLAGAAGILIPIIIHLLNRRSNRVIDWGAMKYLLESIAIRNRRIQLEEALLMACRCLLVGLLALALARPFIPAGSTVPWLVVLPLILVGIVGLGVAAVLQEEPVWRRWIGLSSIGLLIIAGLLVWTDLFNLSRFAPGARQDIAIVIDGSTSMSMTVDGLTNFDRAVEEARTIVKRAPRGHAFSIIVGGPAPSPKILDPTTDRAELDLILDDLNPLDGSMATYHSLTLASLGLARGDNPAKQIILLTDGQNVGWETGKTGRWNFLRDTFKNLPSEPQILLRKMPLPQYLRNVAITDVSLSREIVGVDREVDVTVTVENTGNEAVTPGSLTLQVEGGRQYVDQSLGQLQPGERQVVTFTHQFSEPGAHSVTSTLDVQDDIEQDNRGYAALNIADSLKVLIVDGRPSGKFFDRAATFPAIALAPSSLTLNPNQTPATAFPGADGDNEEVYDPTLEAIRFLVEPSIIGAPNIANVPDYEAYDVVILADVPRLPSTAAQKISTFVKGGGGLLVAPGQKVKPDFYNNWLDETGTPFMPAEFQPNLAVASPDDLITPSAQTLTHPVVQKVSDTSKSDFTTAVITAHWPLVVPNELTKETSVGARMNNGDILLASRKTGDGNVVMLGVPLDTTGGSLPTRQAFLPFLHEVVYYLANPAAYDLNLDPGWDLSLQLAGNRGSIIGEGLRGEYFANHNSDQPIHTRNDPAIQFNWLSGAPAPGVPADNFKVVWTGKLRPPVSGYYRLYAEADDRFDLYIDGKAVIRGNSRGNFKFDSNRWYDIRAEYLEYNSNAHCTLTWETREFGRQIIPPKYFRTFAGPVPNQEDITTTESSLASYSVTGPNDATLSAVLNSTERGSLFKIQGDISSGLYRMKIPEDHTGYFRSFLRGDSDTIPFTVKRDAKESHLSRLTEADFTFLGKFVTISQPETLEDIIGFLSGNQFGQELWKYLAIGAFFFLLLEVALARWIARSRRTGEEITIDFENKDTPTDGFKEQLARMGKA
ncbi:MAG: VWA domain-containing protein [Verrucomicrobiales bacterium]|nr:VWA domain-containing protein [Verrucomicrobiales bacterium]